jgi:dolichol-phosphate mannosyltransferase
MPWRNHLSEQRLLGIVLPIYNEASTIEKTIREVYEVIACPTAANIIACEDGSTDGTKKILQKLQNEIPNLQIVLESQRKGYLRAARDAILACREEFILFLDSDGQYILQDFWKLWQHRNSADIVIGKRLRRPEPLYRRTLSKGLHFLTRILFDLPYSDITSAFRLMNCEAAKHVAQKCQYMGFSFWTEFTARGFLMGYRSIEVPISYRKRNGISRVYSLTNMPKVIALQLLAVFRLWTDLKARELLMFAMVGLSGVGIILGLLEVLVRFGLHYLLAATLAVEASIVWAFALNDTWTFRRRTFTKNRLARFLSYQCIALIGLLINLVSLFLLVDLAHFNYIVGEVCAIAIAFSFNYIFSSRGVWTRPK